MTVTNEAQARSISELVDKIYRENDGNKRINGHEPEYVAEHMGVPLRELFPENGVSLYVGCPYQKLDLKGTLIIDYEFGPVVEFQENLSRFLQTLESQYSRAHVDGIYTLGEDHQESTEADRFLKKIKPHIDILKSRCQLEPPENYRQISHAFSNLKLQVEEEIKRETGEESGDPIGDIDDRVRALWYLAVHGERIQDIYDFKTSIGPELGRYEQTLPSTMPLEERRKAIYSKKRELIENIRLHKTAEEADVVQAIFPVLPLKSNSLETIVAFYSISTYVFPSLDENDFMAYWQEIHRTLKDGGKAFMGPLFSRDEDALRTSMEWAQYAHPDLTFSFREMGEAMGNQEMLVIEKRQIPKTAAYNKDYDYETEHDRLKSDLAVLESTEGFSKLTPDQQRLIKLSLYVQARVERGTDPASYQAIVSPKTHAISTTQILNEDDLYHRQRLDGREDPHTRKYRDSQNFIAEWYCHVAVAALEGDLPVREYPDELPKGFFEADYAYGRDESTIIDHIRKHGYPCVVHVCYDNKADRSDDFGTHHSFVAMGENENGDVVVWDKERESFPFRVTTLAGIYERYSRYGQHNYWGVRELKHPRG